jgi:hypothetical protein
VTEPLLLPRGIIVDLDQDEDPRLVVPLMLGDMQGLQYRRVVPGSDLEQPSVSIAWITIIDDRAPGVSDPGSFDAPTLRWLFADAHLIAVDAAEPDMRLYSHFVERGLTPARVLVIQTVDQRRAIWREFAQGNCDLYGVLELVPVTDEPGRQVLSSVTRFEGRAPPRA